MKPYLLLLWLSLVGSLACSLAVASPDSSSTATSPLLRPEQPAVVWLAPKTGNRYAQGTPIQLYALARDLGTGVAKIEFYDNFDQIIATVTAPNPQGVPELSGIVTWTPTQPQLTFVRVRAFRADGTASAPQELSLEIVASPNPLALPTASPSPASVEATPENAPPATPAPPPPAANTSLTATVNVDVLNVRAAPRTDANIISAVTIGTSLQLVGRSENNEWYATPLASGGFGWVFGANLQIQGDPATLPLATAP